MNKVIKLILLGFFQDNNFFSVFVASIYYYYYFLCFETGCMFLGMCVCVERRVPKIVYINEEIQKYLNIYDANNPMR